MNMNTLRRMLPVLVALLVAMPIAWVGDIHAQAGPQGSTGAQTMQIEGKIKAVDPSGRMVILEDGTQLMIPPTVNIQRENLREGAIVRASFEDRGGQKVVTSMEVR